MTPVSVTRLTCLIVLLATLLSANCRASAEDDTALDAAMAKLGSSFMAGDFGYALEIMYTPMLDAAGGKPAALASSKAVAAQMKAQNIRMVYWKAKPPYQYIAGTSRRYALIPTETAVEISGKKLKINSYQLGIKDAELALAIRHRRQLDARTLQPFLSRFSEDRDTAQNRKIF